VKAKKENRIGNKVGDFPFFPRMLFNFSHIIFIRKRGPQKQKYIVCEKTVLNQILFINFYVSFHLSRMFDDDDVADAEAALQ
jgi:hypothetical protein